MILQSVGSHGVNNANDVVVIQCALAAVRLRGGQKVIAVDGLVGPETIGAINQFQRQQGLMADGRIDEGGQTLPRLTTAIGGAEGVFGPVIVQLFPLVDALREVARTAPPRVRGSIARIAGGYEELNRFRSLAAGLGKGDGRDGLNLVGFASGPASSVSPESRTPPLLLL